MMKLTPIFTVLAGMALATTSVFGQGMSAETAAQLLRARIVSPQLNSNRPTAVLIVAANDKGIKFRENLIQADEPTISLSQVKYFVLEPLDFREAYDLYKNADYVKALSGFKALKAKYQSTQLLPMSYYAMANFYEAECYRHLMNAEELAKVDLAAIAKALPLEGVKMQLDITNFWKRAFNKEWATLQLDIPKFIKSKEAKLTSEQRAQIYYLLGETYAGIDKAKEAIAAFSQSMISDARATPELLKAAGLATMALYAKDKGLIEFMAKNPDPANKKQAVPTAVREAAALLHVLKSGFGILAEIPQEYAKLYAFYKAPVVPKADKPSEKKEEGKVASGAPASPAKVPVDAKKAPATGTVAPAKK